MTAQRNEHGWQRGSGNKYEAIVIKTQSNTKKAEITMKIKNTMNVNSTYISIIT